MKSSILSKKAKPDPELLALKEELQVAQGELAIAYRQFNQVTDPELVESCVYSRLTVVQVLVGKRPMTIPKSKESPTP